MMSSLHPTYPLFPIASFLGFVLVLVPLPWHLQAWNSGTILFMAWTAIANLNLFINAVVWRDDAILRGGIWCDICESPRWLVMLVRGG